MNHLDLFSGIGGFAYAVDQVWPGSTHVFCDNNTFCQKILKKHWSESKIYDDIKRITIDPFSSEYRPERGQVREENGIQGFNRSQMDTRRISGTDILTGGFPCQPFSQAGKRKGTADDRYLWPEMFRVIQLTNPTWIIAENVRGLITWNEGMVLEQVCIDLEAEGYEVQPLIIPAVAVNAPHRRDRVWIIANRINSGDRTPERSIIKLRQESSQKRKHTQSEHSRQGWNKNWREVATWYGRVDDGIPRRLDRLRSLGNAIVPSVAIEIMKCMIL